VSNERSGSAVDRVLKRVENGIEEWRQKDTARKQEAEENREMLWAEAAEREKMLAEAINEEEEGSPISASGQQDVVYVVHSGASGQTLRDLADGRRLVEVISARTDYPGETDLGGSWLVFEKDE
jgi:hypothetical protein